MNERKALLYVDDEPMNLMLFELNFGNDYMIFTADSGNTGLKILEANPDISIVFSDMRMPGMSGIEFIQESQKELTLLSNFSSLPDSGSPMKSRKPFMPV